MKNLPVKLLVFVLICSLFPAVAVPAFSQVRDSSLYDAWLISKKGTSVERKDVLIGQTGGVLKISGTKDFSINKSFPVASIKTADYAFSEKPQIKEAILVGVFLDAGLGALFLFNKTKRHWLILNTETEAVFLELKQENYRQLLFEMNAGGIRVADLGDRDRKETPMPHPVPPADFIEGESCADLFD